MNRLEFVYDGDTLEALVERQGETHNVTVGDTTFSIQRVSDNEYAVIHEGRRLTVAAAFNGDTCFVDVESVLMEIKEPSENGFGAGGSDATTAKDKILAPMPGKVVKIMVEEGQAVEAKQQMVIVEAMKMENIVLSQAAGTVKKINFAPGDQVDTETPIIELELQENES